MQKSIFFVAVLYCCFGFCGCWQVTMQANAATDRPSSFGTIIAMGDSLTAGYGVDFEKSYPALLGIRLKGLNSSFRVVNAGVSGETSSGALARLSQVLIMKPDIVILETGINDGFRGISPTLIRKNIEAIIDHLQEKKIVVVLVGMRMASNPGGKYSQKFQDLYSKLASEKGLIFMPFFLEKVASKPMLNGPDGIHPNEEGYRVIVNRLLPYVMEAIKRREVSTGDSRERK